MLGSSLLINTNPNPNRPCPEVRIRLNQKIGTGTTGYMFSPVCACFYQIRRRRRRSRNLNFELIRRRIKLISRLHNNVGLTITTTTMGLVLLLFILLISLLIFLAIIVRPKPTKIPLKNRHVFITGGSSGIGLALAHQATLDGARVSILARDPTKLQEAKESIKLSTGQDVAVFSADVRDFEAVDKAVKDAGPIDILVCNQGVFAPQELGEQSLEEIKFMVDVNLMGTFHLIKAALPNMKKRDEKGPGSIAIMSSQAGQVGIYGYAAYSASKFGLRGMAEALQQELIGDNVHVSLIFPPDTETPGFAEENKRKPQLTSIIAASSGAMKAEEVAKKALKGIQSGSFIVPCNFEGVLLSIATAGLSPQRSFLMAFVEVVAASILRIAALCFQWNWYASIESWHAQKK